ncbi:Hypothetical predicted protein [Podarcis lilfordi]|uniref:Uncharacterized protein n=1 Tax=Podarcis lilfordi TaxID=74358 RepID=A0AA35PTW7_9SAUR|nr:Hypothetical predicted protein [Podarcis lilfordi]
MTTIEREVTEDVTERVAVLKVTAMQDWASYAEGQLSDHREAALQSIVALLGPQNGDTERTEPQGILCKVPWSRGALVCCRAQCGSQFSFAIKPGLPLTHICG